MAKNEENLGEGEGIRRMKDVDRPCDGQELSTKEMECLIKDISNFSDMIKNILFFHYVFDHSAEEIEEILELKSVKNKLEIIEHWLAQKTRKKKLEPGIMRIMCEQVLKTEMDELMQQTGDLPVYSKSFQKKISQLIPKINDEQLTKKRHRFGWRMLRKIATFACMIGIMLGIHSDETGGKSIEWKLQHFWNHDSFWSEYENQTEKEPDIKKVKINYIPTNLDLVLIRERERGALYWYCSFDGSQRLRIQMNKSNRKEKFSYDTEAVKVKEIFLKKHQAFYWKKEKKYHLLWQEEGISFFIESTIGEKEIIKIAQGILIG